MALAILRSSPARAAAGVGFWLLVLSLLQASFRSSGQAAVDQDELQPSASTTPTGTTALETSTTSFSDTPLPSDTPTPTPCPTTSSLHSPSPTITPTGSVEPSPSIQPTHSPTISPSTSPTPAPPPPTDSPSYPAGSILISEVAWAGTLASSHDEWIELFNPGGQTIDLSGWILGDDDDIDIALAISISPYSFALLERTDDTTVASIPADQVYTGNLNNGGESLYLRDPSGNLVDSANAKGGSWPAGESGSHASMERRGGADQSGNWATFTGFNSLGYDADGNPIRGTPHGINSIHLPVPSSPTPSASSPTGTPTPAATSPPPHLPQFEPLSILINEVAWAGTRASASDEWIELMNPGEDEISLEGWVLEDEGDIRVHLHGAISPHGYYLLERTDDNSVSSVAADLIYSGSLSNGGDALRLLDPGRHVVDSANLQGGSWPAGNLKHNASMERRGSDDLPGNWGTFTGFFGSGVDADGNPIQGTPRQTNSIHFPTPQPTWIPGKIVINELLIRPHYDWQGNGGVDTGDEYIELLNLGPLPVNLGGWMLDDREGAGSKPYVIGPRTLDTGEHIVFFRSRTHIALNDGGDSARLIDPNGNVIDQLTYLRVRAYNLAYGRLPNGSGTLAYGLWPTPGKPNLLFVEPSLEVSDPSPLHCQSTTGFIFPIERMMRNPMTAGRLSASGFRLCWNEG